MNKISEQNGKNPIDTVVEAHRSRLAGLQAEIAEHRRKIEQLTAEMERVQIAIAETEQLHPSKLRTVVGAVAGALLVGAAALAAAEAAKPYRGMRIVEAAKKYLSEHPEGATAPEIAEALRAGGIISESDNLTNTVRSLMDREREHKGTLAKQGRVWRLVSPPVGAAEQVAF